jgi:hypothetical protein
MESKLARQSRQALYRAARELTPEQRLDAVLAHSRLMMELYLAGRAARDGLRRPKP